MKTAVNTERKIKEEVILVCFLNLFHVHFPICLSFFFQIFALEAQASELHSAVEIMNLLREVDTKFDQVVTQQNLVNIEVR